MMMTTTTSDRRYMAAALALAKRALGSTAPNPAVACILVKDDVVIARGVTAPGGRPHAERIAVDKAGVEARGATAFVTLEPCAHHGKTPPCADALISAGVARVVIGCGDPFSGVNGAGIARLKDAGIIVTMGVMEAEARDLNRGFFLTVTEQRPMVTLKLATTLDARIATATGASKWITGPEARARGHLLRARHDAILVGSGTVLADDPSLDCRFEGLEHRSPLKIILDGRGRVPEGMKVLSGALWVTSSDGERAGAEKLQLANCHDLRAVLAALAGRGITRLLVEGGAAVATSFLKADLVDEIWWARAPILFGADGLAAVDSLHIGEIADARRFTLKEIRNLGEDCLEWLVRRD